MQENSGVILGMVFYGFLFILFAITAVVIFVSLRRGGSGGESKPQHRHQYELPPAHVPSAMSSEEKEEYQGKIIQLENTLKYREDEYKRRISALEVKLQEKEKVAGTAAIPKDEVAKKLENLQKEYAKLSEELTLKSQMYEGLKGQYDELEKDMQRMMEHLDGLKKFPTETKPQTPPEPPKPKV